MAFQVTTGGIVKPYIMDLESVNGTFVNGKRIEAARPWPWGLGFHCCNLVGAWEPIPMGRPWGPARYVELREKDVLKFGMSSREFVLLHGGSANHVAIDAT